MCIIFNEICIKEEMLPIYIPLSEGDSLVVFILIFILLFIC